MALRSYLTGSHENWSKGGKTLQWLQIFPLFFLVFDNLTINIHEYANEIFFI